MNKQERQKIRQDLKRRAMLRRFMVYGFMGILVAIFTSAIVLLSEGYYFNLSNRQVIKNGLVFVNTKPTDAGVYINGQLEKDRTESRFTLPEGRYDFSVYKEGYRDWKRSFMLGGSEVVNLDYVLLLPNELKPQELARYKAETRLFSQSLDQRWIVMQRTDSLNTLDIVDTNSVELDVTKITLPSSAFPSGSDLNTLQVVQWSGDNQYMLAKLNVEGKLQFVIINRTDQSKTINISREFGIDAKVLTLRDGKFDRYYFIDQSDNLRDLNLANKSISAPRMERVIDYTSTGPEKLLIVQGDRSGEGAAVWLVEKDNRLRLANTTRQSPESYLLDLANYDGDWYIVYGSTKDQTATIFKNTFDVIRSQTTPKPLAKLDVSSPKLTAVSRNSRYIAVSNDKQIIVFDNEFERTYRYDTPVENIDGFSEITWMDGARMILASKGRQYLLDYDGINLQDVGAANKVGPVAFDRNTERMYSIGNPEAGTSGLFRTSLLTQP